MVGYSRELSSCGFFPGRGDEGAFYNYAYPEPYGFGDNPVGPEEGHYSKELGEFLLPYEAVRRATDPDRVSEASWRSPPRSTPGR